MTSTKKKISKSTLSIFLRTKCDRELYLSLHTPTELENHNMPVPLDARPGIGVLQTAGIDFEDVRNKQLIDAFGNLVIFKAETGNPNKPTKAPLKDLLNQVSATPAFVLQGKFEPSGFQQAAMVNMGLQSADAALVPPVAGLIPDIIVVRAAHEHDEEISKSGSRLPVNMATETRKALSIIDVKHTSEANPSYSAEVALYAIFLANWLESQGLQQQYFVTIRSYLWTRFKQGQSQFDALMQSGSQVTPQQYLDALLSDCEDVNLRFYLPTVLHFFREDLMRVIKAGEESADGWEKLEWHVDGRCSSCDWLGHEKWATTKDKAKIAAKPSHYCYQSAKATGHLSQIAGLTRGARKTLQINAIPNTAAAATAQSVHPAFQEHSHLKKERSRIPARATSLLSNATTINDTALLASLAPYPQFYAAVAVNFDPSAGLMTGLSLMGRVTAYVQGQSPRVFQTRSFVVDQKTLDEEWVALEGLLSTLSDMIDQSEAFVRAANKTPLTAQIAFWEKRQFEELCAAMGRHLPKVMALTNRKTRALAWLFPADELLEKPDGAVSPCIVFADEIVRRVVFAPTPHVITLFDTAEHYFSGPNPIRATDAYYREFLTNGIPRERIYEIWSNASVIKRGSVTTPRNTVIQEFANALDRQCRALSSVVEKLRTDFRGQLKANAPKLSLSIPSGARNVAFDSKLWVWWDELQYQTDKLEAHQRLALDGEALEASYEAVRLTNGRVSGNPDEFIYDVLPGSTEAKFDDSDGFLVLGKEGFCGFPLQHAQDVLQPNAPIYPGDDNSLKLPLWSSLTITLLSFDRSARSAVIRFSHRNDANFVAYLLANSAFDLMNDVFITKGQSSFKWFDISKSILAQVGNPSIATPDLNAASAMGMQPSNSGNDAVTPIARILWDAPSVQATSVMAAAEASVIANTARTAHNLNDSQRDAVAHAMEKGLTVIWGPPGTGKTQTLTACIDGLVRNANSAGAGIKILISGPTYKAVEELIGRVIESLSLDNTLAAEIYAAYSTSRLPTPFSSNAAHLKVTSFNLSQYNQETQECLASLADQDTITIVATSTMQAHKLSEWATGTKVGGTFDVVMIDESSQVQLTHAISPLATLKTNGRVIVAGDHLQMPPIMSLEPPVGAEYLVGSIQAYLLRRFTGAVNTCPLETNYRSAEDIVSYARLIGYRSTLTAASPDTALHFIQAIPTPESGYPASLPWSPLWPEILQADRKVLTLLHEDDLSSQSNKFEAKIVAGIVWCMKNSVSDKLDGREPVTHSVASAKDFWEKCIGIVTPHRAQRALVIRELKALFPNDPADLIDSAVDTVEKFQGGQRHTIIVTFGVGDADVIAGEEAFLMQLERTNVAISRAMAKCIVIMPMTLAGHVPQDKKALETAHAIKDYVDEFCNVEIIGEVDGKKSKVRYHKK